MKPHDTHDESLEELPPSKTKIKKQMHDLRDLGKELTELSREKWRELDLPESLFEALVEYKRISKFGAQKRQLQYIGKLMRDVDTAPILADANCTLVCIYMSLVLLAASLIYELTGFGFIDSLGAIGLAAREKLDLDAEMARIQAFGATVVTLADDSYPRLLREVSLPPPVLYIKGSLLPADDYAVAVQEGATMVRVGQAILGPRLTVKETGG